MLLRVTKVLMHDLSHRHRVGYDAAMVEQQKHPYRGVVSWNRSLNLVSAVCAAVGMAVSPVATADSGSPSYNAGRQAIDNLVNIHHVQFPADTDWPTYCEQVRANALRTGQILQIDSPPDFIAGCQDEGRTLVPSK